jgi:hypothetical protein
MAMVSFVARWVLGMLLFCAAALASTLHTGTVIETMNSGGYTYMKVDEKGEVYWVAVTEHPVKKGENVRYYEQMWMENFPSRTLGRTFERILFASVAQTHRPETEAPKLPDIMTSAFQRGGTVSIAELFAKRDALAGKHVRVRGRVTKVSEQIMGLNWVHLQDGSRFSGMDDLVFTSKNAVPEVGSIVTAKGKAAKDRDFGYGYFYPLIVEEASFSAK